MDCSWRGAGSHRPRQPQGTSVAREFIHHVGEFIHHVGSCRLRECAALLQACHPRLHKLQGCRTARTLLATSDFVRVYASQCCAEVLISSMPRCCTFPTCPLLVVSQACRSPPPPNPNASARRGSATGAGVSGNRTTALPAGTVLCSRTHPPCHGASRSCDEVAEEHTGRASTWTRNVTYTLQQLPGSKPASATHTLMHHS